ncbi:hypothetical protein BDP55DRAFT_637580 [Colletotrichum godetiae]|uniref:Uncharacterized protein n=1 Tax=Colletotrichum godetiae TaxID=1209918 RepID=A0AAJ0ERQ8_9PEZI|nr:uncharacterized protein BDP55DRAFT_637580 [Colletotrichum godetiae]KAK1658774.1 hypothetical protein BDP55DRAFT_637580 [Colletotrichum godetiae]
MDSRENLATLMALPPPSITSLQGQAFLSAISTCLANYPPIEMTGIPPGKGGGTGSKGARQCDNATTSWTRRQASPTCSTSHDRGDWKILPVVVVNPHLGPPVLSINGEEQEGARRRKVKQVDLPVGIWPLPAARHAARLPPMSQPVHSLPVDC